MLALPLDIIPKRKCKFTDELKRKFPCLKETGNGNVLCNRCGSVFSIAHGERADLNNHLGSKEYKISVKAAASSSRVTSFFKNIGSDAPLALAAKEATFAYHSATHRQNFRSFDCISKLVSKLFEPKFSLGKTKCEAIIVKVIAPMCTDELHQELDRINFATVTIYASNIKVKLSPIVVRYFLKKVALR